MRACVHACVHACVRAGVHACVRAGEPASVRACEPASVRACKRASARARGRAGGRAGALARWALRSGLCSTTQTCTSPPPQASMVANPPAGFGWNWSLGKTARFAGHAPPSIPHKSSRPPSHGTARHSPYDRSQLEQCPLGVLGQCLDLTAPSRTKAGRNL